MTVPGLWKKLKEVDENIYELKAQNALSALDKKECEYFYNNAAPSFTPDWNVENRSLKDAIELDLNIDVDYPEELAGEMLSPFLQKCSARKLLQQIAWATCCGVDTMYKDKITLVPFFASETTEPDIVINNSDDRTLKAVVSEGEKYSKILWHKTTYLEDKNLSNLGKVDVKYNESLGRHCGEIFVDFPCWALDLGTNNYSTFQDNPYHIAVDSDDTADIPKDEAMEWEINGYKYIKSTETVEISTGIKNGETLEITNQTLYPIDDSKKVAQLKKWYSANNTLTATIVDNDNQIRLGKVLKIQLKNGKYFQGIVTKLNRSNISNYHTVDLEAHEWN